MTLAPQCWLHHHAAVWPYATSHFTRRLSNIPHCGHRGLFPAARAAYRWGMLCQPFQARRDHLSRNIFWGLAPLPRHVHAGVRQWQRCSSRLYIPPISADVRVSGGGIFSCCGRSAILHHRRRVPSADRSDGRLERGRFREHRHPPPDICPDLHAFVGGHGQLARRCMIRDPAWSRSWPTCM